MKALIAKTQVSWKSSSASRLTQRFRLSFWPSDLRLQYPLLPESLTYWLTLQISNSTVHMLILFHYIFVSIHSIDIVCFLYVSMCSYIIYVVYIIYLWTIWEDIKPTGDTCMCMCVYICTHTRSCINLRDML